LTEHQAMKAYWGSGSITPGILDLGIKWSEWSASRPGPLYPEGRSTWYPLEGGLVGPRAVLDAGWVMR